MYPVMTKRSPYVYQPHQTHQPHQPHQPQQTPKQPVPLQLPQQTPYLPHTQSSYKASQPPNEPQLNQPQAAELQMQTGVRNRYSKELIMLNKIYKDDDKFGGTDDNFSFKATIFLDKCRRVGLPEDAYIQGASIMLSGQAQTYYYANRGNNSTFDQFCSNMQSFFEGPEWQRFNPTKWQTISLNNIISANPTLSTIECVRKLCTELDTIQRGVDSAYHGTVHLRENIIQACRGHPSLAAGLTSPPSDTSDLINNLYTFIVNYEAVHKPTQQSYLNENEENELYFTDRQYRKSKFKPQGQRYHKFGNTSRVSSQTSPQRKRCFVCGKEGCWSTNHSQQERDDSRKRFGNRFPEYKSRPRYERYLQQYIINYEGEEDDDTADVAHFFKELLIDAPQDLSLDTDTTNELFLTQLDPLQNIESTNTINLLADNAFKHQITSADTTIPLANPMPYNFTTSIDLRYNDSEFKGLLINSGAATRSTGGVGQLKALQRILSVELDKTTTGSTNFVFGIGSISSIGTVTMDTPLGIIVFHIAQVNTPFLLYLADIDKLGAFFNNLTNEVIQSNRSYPVIRRYGHAFLFWCTSAYFFITKSFMQNPCYLTDIELCHLHCRFGHPSVRRLQQVLERSGHKVELHVLEHLTKYCEHCQKHGRSPGQFSFIIKDDIEFNYNVIVDYCT